MEIKVGKRYRVRNGNIAFVYSAPEYLIDTFYVKHVSDPKYNAPQNDSYVCVNSTGKVNYSGFELKEFAKGFDLVECLDNE